eukprot:COSAG01_NODE_577_length_15268_cov_31.213462_8_plen_296_part_00
MRSASWAPKYDLRTSLSEANATQTPPPSSGGDDSGKGAATAAAAAATQQPSMSLTYFGVVRQSTGEDWSGVSLSLSTASPATGGTPPAPPTRKARWAQPKILAPRRKGMKVAFPPQQQRQQMPMQQMQMQMPMQASMTVPDQRRLSIDAAELSDDCDEADTSWGGAPPAVAAAAGVATANVTSGGAGAANFSIERRSTINADNKEHKVTITIVDIAPELQYFATPALEEKVYLQARCVNNSACPLLASAAVAIFLDGSFVAKTHLKHTSPGEAFSVFLGVPPRTCRFHDQNRISD